MFLRSARFTRHLIVTVALLAVALGAALDGSTPHATAGGSWSAWLYNSDTGRLAHVFPDGVAAAEYQFPLPPGVAQYPYSVTFSRDGALVAACNTDTSGNVRIDVYDMFNNYFVGQYVPGGPAMGCHLSRYAFSEDGTLLAVGLIYHYPGEPNDTRPEWELVVIQMNSNAVIARLPADSPLVAGLGMDLRGQLPFVSTFQMPTANFPGLISFYPVRWGTEGACEYDALIWNLGQNSVYPGANAGKNSLDILFPNSEATWVETNEAYPQGTMMGPGCTHNMVMYSNKAGDRYPLFTNGDILSGTAFVDDGRLIAFNSGGYEARRWYALDRNGSVFALPGDVQAFSVWGTLNGYVFANTPGDSANFTEVRYHQFNGTMQPQVFSAWASPTGEHWQIVYATPLSGGLGLSPFPQMPQVGTPPQAPAGLSVGGRAEVNTTEGDFLRVRTGPGTSFAVAFQLNDGTPVTVMEGPVAAEGYTWWRVQTADGRSGWVVEGVQEATGFLETLIALP